MFGGQGVTEGRILTGDGCALAYRIDGAETAPVLVLSNSLGTTMSMWESQMGSFTQRFRVLRYDSRGHGRSDVPKGAYSLDRLGRDVIELADALAIGQFMFCGLSKGGMVGQWLGWRAPERLTRLVLANTSAFMGPPASWDDRIRMVRERGMGAISDAVLERWFTPAYRSRPSAALRAVQKSLLDTSPNGYAGCSAAIRDMDQRKLLRLVNVATLVIAGESDPATPLEQARALVDGIKDARLHVLSAAHLSNIEQPTLFAQAVLSFASVGGGEMV